jgi:hypothetical protein
LTDPSIKNQRVEGGSSLKAEKPITGGSSYASRTSTGSHLLTSAISSHPESGPLLSRPFLVGPPEFDLYGDQGEKSSGSTNDYLGEAEEKVEREDDLASEGEDEYKAESQQEVTPPQERTWGFSRARMPQRNDGHPDEENSGGKNDSSFSNHIYQYLCN